MQDRLVPWLQARFENQRLFVGALIVHTAIMIGLVVLALRLGRVF